MDHVSLGHQHDADARSSGGRPSVLSRTGGARRAGFAALLILAAAAFAALGAWQVERRAWKLDLIAAVDARVHAPAVAAPGPSDWPSLTTANDAYRHVEAEGTWLCGYDTRVQALTELGAGSWVLTPLQTDAGWIVLVNRGFVPTERGDPGPSAGPVRVTGLLRLTEPGGGFLRSNDSAGNRWYSRDVAGITRARGLSDTAPYFIDAAAGSNRAALPVGGLTVIAFHNSHLVYALTWFGLAALSLFGLSIVLHAAPSQDT